MNDKDFLLEIFNSDYLGLIDKVPLPKKAEPRVETNLASQKEKEVQDWIDTHGREPSEKSQDITERILAKRHKAMKKDVKTVNDVVQRIDQHGDRHGDCHRDHQRHDRFLFHKTLIHFLPPVLFCAKKRHTAESPGLCGEK